MGGSNRFDRLYSAHESGATNRSQDRHDSGESTPEFHSRLQIETKTQSQSNQNIRCDQQQEHILSSNHHPLENIHANVSTIPRHDRSAVVIGNSEILIPTVVNSESSALRAQDRDGMPNAICSSRRDAASVERSENSTPVRTLVGELRSAALDTLRYPIQDTAEKTRLDEDGQQSERMRQVFGMSWLMRNCDLNPSANIPRNSVYAAYVNTCSAFRLRPLTHASFGKLVHMVFPMIRTRRLGVRGHSKYHYCGISLRQVPQQSTFDRSMSYVSEYEGVISTGQAQSLLSIPSKRYTNTEEAGASVHMGYSWREAPAYTSNPFPSHELKNPESGQPANFSIPNARVSPKHDSVESFSQAAPAGSNPTTPSDMTLALPLVLPQPPLSPPLLPLLQEFTNNSATGDKEEIVTLNEKYRTHCQACFELLTSFNYKKMLRVVGTFAGSLPESTQRLLTEPDVLVWVATCDWAVFTDAIAHLQPMVMMHLPPQVLGDLNLLLNDYPRQLKIQTRRLPSEYANTKIQASQPFLNLIDRFLRVNETFSDAHIAIQRNREEMQRDWTQAVTAAAAREVPSDYEQLVTQHLRYEIPKLLESVPQEAPLDGWVDYLRNLTAQLPACPRRSLGISLTAIGSACLRDLNRTRSATFGSWWSTISWISEYLRWMDELEVFRLR